MQSAKNEYQIRPIEMTDVAAVHAVLADGANRWNLPVTPIEQIAQFLEMFLPQIPESSPLLLSPKGEVVAFLLAIPQGMAERLEVQVEVGLDPAYQNEEALGAMSAWMTERLQAFAESKGLEGVQLRGSFDDSRKDLIQFFENWGFAPFITQIRMQRDLSIEIPVPEFPTDIALRSYSAKDSEAMRDVFNVAFANHWIGHLTPEAWQARFMDTEKFRADQTILAWRGDNLVGFYLSESVEDDPEQGWLEVMVVDPSEQRRGIGKSLLQHALQVYQAAGFASAGLDVDRESASNAMVLYEKSGFEKIKGTCYYLRTI